MLKEGRLNIQEEDQEGTSAERRNQKGPEGSNAQSRPEQQETSRPSIIDTVPPHIVAEMQMMKERMDFMMNALRGRVSSDLNDLVHRTNLPFTMPVTSFLPSIEVSYVASGKLRRIQGPPRSLGVFQDPDAPSRGGRRDHVQSLPTMLKGLVRI